MIGSGGKIVRVTEICVADAVLLEREVVQNIGQYAIWALRPVVLTAILCREINARASWLWLDVKGARICRRDALVDGGRAQSRGDA